MKAEIKYIYRMVKHSNYEVREIKLGYVVDNVITIELLYPGDYRFTATLAPKEFLGTGD